MTLASDEPLKVCDLETHHLVSCMFACKQLRSQAEMINSPVTVVSVLQPPAFNYPVDSEGETWLKLVL